MSDLNVEQTVSAVGECSSRVRLLMMSSGWLEGKLRPASDPRLRVIISWPTQKFTTRD